MKVFQKLFWGGQILFIALLSGCGRSTADNQGLNYTQLDVNFEATVQCEALTAEDEVAVFATCTRGSDIDVKMSQNFPAQFIPVSAGNTVNLIKKTAEDNILSYAGDHNFKFSAFLPFSAYDGDLTSLNASVPSVVDYSNKTRALQVAHATKTSVVAPTAFDFKCFAANMVMNIPGTILGDDKLPVLKSLEINAYDPDAFDGMLAFDATYDLTTGSLTVVEGSAKRTMTIDFGTEGLALKTGYTPVSFDVAPFTMPSGGLIVTITDIDGNKVDSEVFINNGGTEYKAGQTIEVNLTRSGEDGIVPCTSPVEWPIGYENCQPRALSSNYVDLWPTNMVNTNSAAASHVWKNLDQPQATAKWIIGQNPYPTKVGYEFGQFPQYNYACPCVKGIWTGDGMEFSIPVKKIPAGTEVTITLPSCGRGAPVFWNIQYLDGTEWKYLKRTLKKSPDGQFECMCSWVIPHGNVEKAWKGHIMTETMTLKNPIRSGYIKIRFVCASGAYISALVSTEGNNTCYQVTTCVYDGNHLITFVNIDDICKAVSISWKKPQKND